MKSKTKNSGMLQRNNANKNVKTFNPMGDGDDYSKQEASCTQCLIETHPNNVDIKCQFEKIKNLILKSVKENNNLDTFDEFTLGLKHVVDIQALMQHTHTITNNKYNVLQLAAYFNLSNYVEYLLSSFPDIEPDISNEKTPSSIFLAVTKSNVKVVKVFIEHKIKNTTSPHIKTVRFDQIDAVYGRTLFHAMPLYFTENASLETIKVLLTEQNPVIVEELKRVVNLRDECNYTALDHAVISPILEYTKLLLNFGASITPHGDSGGEEILTQIPPEMLEDVLNNHCLKFLEPKKFQKFSSFNRLDLTSREIQEISVNFDFLAPTNNNIKGTGFNTALTCPQRDDVEEGTAPKNDRQDELIYPETEVLWYMANSERHRHLLAHPVIVLFMLIKWTHIKLIYNLHLVFYLTFASCITGYIVAKFGENIIEHCKHEKSNNSITDMQNESQNHFNADVLWYINCVLLTIQIIREVYQLSFSLSRYAFSLINWLKAINIVLISILLYQGNYQFYWPFKNDDDDCNLDNKRIVAAATIIISWSLLYVMLLKNSTLRNVKGQF